MTRRARNALRALVPVLGREAAEAVVADLEDAWEERAAICEYHGGLTRAAAEAMADKCVWYRAAETWRAGRGE